MALTLAQQRLIYDFLGTIVSIDWTVDEIRRGIESFCRQYNKQWADLDCALTSAIGVKSYAEMVALGKHECVKRIWEHLPKGDTDVILFPKGRKNSD